PFQVVHALFRRPLPEILVIQRQGAEGAVLVVAPAGKLDGEHGLGREVLAERKAVEVRRRQRIDVFGKKRDRKSTRLNSSHDQISYAVFCLKKKKITHM